MLSFTESANEEGGRCVTVIFKNGTAFTAGFSRSGEPDSLEFHGGSLFHFSHDGDEMVIDQPEQTTDTTVH